MQGFPTSPYPPRKPPRPAWQTWLIIVGAVIVGSIGMGIGISVLKLVMPPKPDDTSSEVSSDPSPKPRRRDLPPTTEAVPAAVDPDQYDQAAMVKRCAPRGVIPVLPFSKAGQPGTRYWKCEGPEAPTNDPNVFKTKKGYIGATTRAKLDKAVELAVSDVRALQMMLATDPDVFPIGEGMEVVAVDAGGFLSGVAKVRKKGTTFEFWTVREALD